jgi:DNA-binding XRE family transcriptional regulator
MTTRVEQLAESLRSRLPRARIEVDAPSQGGGTWWVDVRQEKQVLSVQWNSSMGFGLSSLPSDGYGDGPDEFYETETEVADRVAHLLSTGERTAPPDSLALKRLREARGVSQVELARRMGVTQATISKLEHRADPSLTSVREWVAALGGHLEVQAKFDDRTVTVDVSGK